MKWRLLGKTYKVHEQMNYCDNRKIAHLPFKAGNNTTDLKNAVCIFKMNKVIRKYKY